MPAFRNLTSKKFGKLTVIKLNHKDKSSKSFWLCQCDCGKEKIIRSDALIAGITLSCGCFHKEQNKFLQTLPDGLAAFNKKYQAYRRAATDRNLIG